MYIYIILYNIRTHEARTPLPTLGPGTGLVHTGAAAASSSSRRKRSSNGVDHGTC